MKALHGQRRNTGLITLNCEYRKQAQNMARLKPFRTKVLGVTPRSVHDYRQLMLGNFPYCIEFILHIILYNINAYYGVRNSVAIRLFEFSEGSAAKLDVTIE